MMRRASLPFRSTEGFHPQPRLIFALSLPLGMVGLREVVEIEWLEPLEPDEVHARLSSQAPEGLYFVSTRRIEMKNAAKPRRAFYRMLISDAEREGLPSRCEAAMASGEMWVERERPRPRQVNIRPYLKALTCSTTHLEMEVWITQEGGARADEIVRALDLNHLLDQGAIIERADLEIWDEIDPALAAIPLPLPQREDRFALERPSKLPAKKLESETTSALWGASPNGPIVE